MNTKEKIKSALPFEQDFTAGYIANIVFPNRIISDTEGRMYNPCVGFVSKMLRKMEGVIEPSKKVFWATW